MKAADPAIKMSVIDSADNDNTAGSTFLSSYYDTVVAL
jgi:hypothetical protein